MKITLTQEELLEYMSNYLNQELKSVEVKSVRVDEDTQDWMKVFNTNEFIFECK